MPRLFRGDRIVPQASRCPGRRSPDEPRAPRRAHPPRRAGAAHSGPAPAPASGSRSARPAGGARAGGQCPGPRVAPDDLADGSRSTNPRTWSVKSSLLSPDRMSTSSGARKAGRPRSTGSHARPAAPTPRAGLDERPDDLGRVDGDVEHLGEERRLGIEVVVHEPGVHAGRAGNPTDRGAVVALVTELGARGPDDQATRVLTGRPPPRGLTARPRAPDRGAAARRPAPRRGRVHAAPGPAFGC